MRTRLLIVLAVLAAAFLLNACGGGSSTMVTQTPQVSVDSITPSAKSVEQGQQQALSFTASLSGDTTGAGVFWGASCSVSQCGTIKSTSPLAATYTPPTGTLTASLTVTITATSSADSSKLKTLAITVVPAVAPPAAASTPVTATINSPINLALVSPGTGTPPFNLVVSAPTSSADGTGITRRAGAIMRSGASSCSAVPAWLSSLFNSQTGAISGTVPGTATDFHCNVAVTDAAGVTSPAATVQITVPILFVGTTLPGGQQGETGYSATLMAQGGSGSYTFTGTLPAGLSLATNGSISGSIPLSAPSSLTLTAQATDSAGATSTAQTFTIQVTQTVQVSVDSVTPTATQVEQGQQPLTVTAAVSGDPAAKGVVFGLSCNAAQCGTLTPSATSNLAATYAPPTGTLAASLPVTITATSVADSTKSNKTTINAIPGVAISSAASTPVTASINSPLTLQLVTSGTGVAPYTLAISATPSGVRMGAVRRTTSFVRSSAQTGSCTAVPAWLASLFNNQTGAISGTVSGSALDFDCSITVTDSLGVTSPAAALQIAVPVLLQAGSLPAGQQGESAYSASLASFAEGGTGTYTFSGSLPGGLTLAAGGSISGSIGITAPSSLNFTATVTDSNNVTAMQSYSISVTQLVISVDSLTPSATQIEQGQQQPLTLTAVVSGDPAAAGVTFSVSCSVAQCGTVTPSAGSNLSASYTPPAGTLTASLPVTITATSVTDPTKSKSVMINAIPGVTIASSASAPVTASIGSSFSLQLVTPGTGVAPFSLAISTAPSTTLSARSRLAVRRTSSAVRSIEQANACTAVPAWLASLFNNQSGTISGTVPGTALDFDCSITVTDSLGVTSPAAALQIAVPVVLQAGSLPAGQQGESAYSASLANFAEGGTGTYTFAGSLPAGLTLGADGSISGSIANSAPNTLNFTATVTDTNSVSAMQSYTISVTQLVISVSSVTPSASQIEQGQQQPLTLTAVVSGDPSGAGVTFSVSCSAAQCGTVTPTSSLVATYTPPAAALTASLPVTITATSVADPTKSNKATITAVPTLTIMAPVPSTLVATIGNPYNLTLQTNTGTGLGAVTWAETTGNLAKAGLQLSPAGVISAAPVPASAITQQINLRATDSVGVVANLPVTITVAITITTPAQLTTGEQTQASYTATLAAEGGTGPGTYTWAVSQGSSLPSGLMLAANGTISGSLAANATAQPFSVTVTDSGTGSQQQQFTIPIDPQVAIAQPSAQSLSAAIGTNNLSVQLTTVGAGTQTPTGIGPFTWSFANGFTPPIWLNLSSSGVLSTTQAVPNNTTNLQFTVQVKDSVNVTNSLPLTLTISIVVSGVQLSNGEVSLAYTSSAVTAQGGSGTYTWSATGLPAGLSINPNTAVISGTPTAPTTQGQMISVKATDSLSATGAQQFPLTVFAQVAVSPATLQGGTVNTSYSQPLSATGGASPYSNWTVLSGSGSLPAGLTLDPNTGTISGTPACPASTATFSVTVQDALSVTSAPQQFSLATSTVPLTIITTSIPNDTIGTAYSQQLQSSGGACGGQITWSVAPGSAPLPGWLQLSPSGMLTGTPAVTDAGTSSFTLQVTDGTNTVMQSYTILVGGGFNVSGTISLVNGGGPLQGVVVSLGTGLSATTDASGNFTIAHALSGTYTATLGFPSAPSSAFVPTSSNITNTNGTFTITVANSDLTGVNFSASLGYKVSGKVHYHGGHFHGGQVYLSLLNAACASCPAIQGTSLLPPEDAVVNPPNPSIPEFFDLPFVINGVPPGTYTLQGFMDFARYGLQNAYDPAGTAPITVSIASGNVTNASVTLLDPTAAGDVLFTGAWGPSSLKFSPMDNGVIIQYQPIIKNGVEQALYYELQWAASDTGTCEGVNPDGGFTITPGFFNPIAAGSGRIVILDFNSPGGPVGGAPDFMTGSQVFLCMRGVSITPSGQPSFTGFQFFNGISPITIGAPAAPSGTNTVSGTVTIPAAVQPSGPLYAGCYDLNSGKMFIDPSNESPVPGGNPYSVSGVPTGDSCFVFAMMDQNNDGFITPSNQTNYVNASGGLPPVGDIYNINQPNPTVVQITGNTTQDVDLTPFANNSSAVVMTDHIQAVDLSGNPQEGYNLNIDVTPLMGVPVEATLLSGPNAVTPVDLAICTTCGGEQSQFNVSLSTNGIRPQVGDTYVIQISYNDPAQLPDVLTLTVTGVSDAFATSLTPIGSVAGMTTPTFSWTDPSSPSNYMYQFLLSDSSGNTIWQIPGVNSFFSLFPSSITSIPWSTTKDPTGAKNPPSVTSLTSGTTYTWSISVQDSNGNTAIKQVAFRP